MLQKNKSGFLSFFGFVLLMLISSISVGLFIFGAQSLKIERNFLYSTHAYYAAETGIEEGLFELKINPDEDSFVWEKRKINQTADNREIEYRDQYFYRLERVIEELVPAGENIQLFFDNKLNPNITKFHIAYLKANKVKNPTSLAQCTTPFTTASVEVGVFSSVRDVWGGSVSPLLSSLNNRCESGFGASSKGSSNTITDPYSDLGKITISGGRCLLNNKGNVSGGSAVFENSIPYIINNGSCSIADGSPNEKYYKTDEEVFNIISGYQTWTTVVDGLNVANTITRDTDRIVLEIRAVDDDSYIAVWATDDAGNAYDIPGRYIHFTATGKASGLDGKEQDLYRRLIVKKKKNQDLLPIFDYTLFSESEFIK